MWASSFAATLEAPVAPKSGTVPPNHGRWLYEDERRLPTRPESPQRKPQEPVAIGDLWLLGLPSKDRELVAQRQIFERKTSTALDCRDNTSSDASDYLPHESWTVHGFQ